MNLFTRSLTFLFFIFCFTGMNAQSWFQTGDTWVYNYFNVWGRSGFEEVWVGGDTVIDNQACKILNSEITYVNIYSQDYPIDTIVITGDPFFVYEQSDGVYGYFEDEFKLLYDFSSFDLFASLIVREGEGHPDACSSDLYFEGTESSEIFINNINRQVFQYRLIPLASSSFYGEHEITVVQGIGIVSRTVEVDQPFYEEKFGHIIPGKSYPCAYDSDRWSFCSFISQGEEYNPGNDDCYYLPSAVSLNEQLTSPAEYLLYPNPASTYFSIGNNDDFKFEKIRIYDLSGNVVKVVKQLTDKILVSDLIAGMYIVEIKVDEQLIYEKLLVE